MNDASRYITVIDQTLREGMQFCGLMFSESERRKILAYQNAIGVDICQAAYPSAHASEKRILAALTAEARKNGWAIRLAGLGRGLAEDARIISVTGVKDVQLHIVMGRQGTTQEKLGNALGRLETAVTLARERVPDACIEINILDVGRVDMRLLEICARHLIEVLRIDILTLPDTSGMLWPDRFGRIVQAVAEIAEGTATRIGVHCHNDLGMANANTVTGVVAGASVVEVSALGIGERNGIGDLFVVAKVLSESGYTLGLSMERIEQFEEYYAYVDDICRRKTGVRLLDARTPFFGSALKTHVAGTHARDTFGLHAEADYHLNVLCGKRLVKKYLEANGIAYDPADLATIVETIKDKSAALGRSITASEMKAMAARMRPVDSNSN